MLDRLGGLRMKSIDDAITHCLEVAEEKECTAHSLTKDGWQEHFNNLSQEKEAEYKNVREEMANSCLECASEHRQLAEWLRELKAYREELPKEIKNAKVRQADALEANVKNENYNSHLAEYIKGYLCGLSYTEGIIAKIIEEENADE